jgi:hypothetical protein
MNYTLDDFRVVVGLDFRTTYSGFSYCHVNCEDIITSDTVCGNVAWGIL